MIGFKQYIGHYQATLLYRCDSAFGIAGKTCLSIAARCRYIQCECSACNSRATALYVPVECCLKVHNHAAYIGGKNQFHIWESTSTLPVTRKVLPHYGDLSILCRRNFLMQYAFFRKFVQPKPMVNIGLQDLFISPVGILISCLIALKTRIKLCFSST